MYYFQQTSLSMYAAYHVIKMDISMEIINTKNHCED